MKKIWNWILLRLPLYSKLRVRKHNVFWHNYIHRTRPPHVLYHFKYPDKRSVDAPGNEEIH